ncbi:uncharacterized protein EV154DRAFT_485966 [Mucor mucedo]|uniref:uncharacterized protein n=1 Tax=Mucor mucedo TaxID=29922 RepID=UPI00221EC03D|nr:uncharacterized protein EV154DRAFT_485966 [Mucor mucedo]KAI7880011.1 hypothetical protein EV154DRAFT_485966 [Mucor mucedo]
MQGSIGVKVSYCEYGKSSDYVWVELFDLSVTYLSWFWAESPQKTTQWERSPHQKKPKPQERPKPEILAYVSFNNVKDYQKLQDERRHHRRVKHIRKKPKTKPLILANITPVFGDETFLEDYKIPNFTSGYLVLPLSFFHFLCCILAATFLLKLPVEYNACLFL